MEADFSGYATKAGLKCSDGRVIFPDAFKHQDTKQVPLVWQHGHTDPKNVLGHAVLEHRQDGVYCYGFFNGSDQATHSKELLTHGDIKHLSIWANELIERGGKVLHGVIREVSLVLSGANPGALIESVTIRHSDGDTIVLEDEAIIYTGLEIEHAAISEQDSEEEDEEDELAHAAAGDETIQDVYDSMSDKQKQVLHFMIGQAIQDAQDQADQMQQDNMASNDSEKEGTTEMPQTHNIFEKDESKAPDKHVISHSDMEGIVADARQNGSLRQAVKNYALSHGIDDIEILFPEARAVGNTPEWNKRRTEWVAKVIDGARKSPFSRIKTLSADITEDEARAKGYIKGNLKKEEFFSVARRITSPTTIYKKQKLDRDDVIDISDFDVVAWLKGEMRLMLDEEIARAILFGDGRDIASDDKINEQCIRPIMTDHDLYVTKLFVNVADASSSYNEIIDSIILNRHLFKGTGQPTFFTTENVIAQFTLLKDTTGRRLYSSIDEVARDLRVAEIVPVEVMETEPDLVGILVNMSDYVLGADQGGQVTMFDDFDIDYNQQKYLIETRLSGALTKLKSAIVVKTVASGDVALAAPTAPTYDSVAAEITIPTMAHVAYKDSADDSTLTGTVDVDPGTATTVYAEAAAGYYFPTSAGTSWTFRNRNSS
jgi:hypothetical protein